MEFIITQWLRNNSQLFPTQIVQLIVDTFIYDIAFDLEHDGKLKNGGGVFQEFARHFEKREEAQDPSKRYDYLIKLVLIGEYHAGKTSLFFRYRDDEFPYFYRYSMGIDFMLKTIIIEGMTVKLQIWRTSGQQRFRTMTSAYYRGADGVILVYDVTDKESFERIAYWNGQCLKYGSHSLTKILVGNKADLEQERVVTTEQGQKLAIKLGLLDHLETSAKTGENVEIAIETIASRVFYKIQRMKTPWIG